MRFDPGAVRVPGWVWSGLVTFFHEETPALELQLGVGAARGGLGVGLAEQMLGGDRKGAEAPGAQ